MTLVGRALAGRYDVLALLGEGGMGEVYRARDRELDELVALKVIRADLAREPAIVERFRHEVKLARRVTHVNVARTYELGTADGVMFCTMELVDGEPLTHRLRRVRRLPIGEAVAIAAALCDGLAAAHAVDVVHRDIKPDNVLLAADGRVVVADFGVAAMRAPVRLDLSGTPAYMAPEQARGEPATPAADVYAVGVLLFEMVTGRRAFAGEVTKILADKLAVERVQPGPGELPVELAAVIGRATARDAHERIESATALREALAPWHEARATPVLRPAATELAGDALTVSVPPPTGGDAKRYLADAVHDEVIARIGKLPRVRVRPRADREAEVVVTLIAGDELAVEIAREGTMRWRLQLPLAIQQIAATADAIAGLVATAAQQPPPAARASREDDVLELMFRARHLASQDFRRIDEALALLAQGAERAPDHPQIAALLAVAEVRLAFLKGDADPLVFTRAAARARAAVAAAPRLVTAHLALGHVELTVGDPVVAAGHFRMAIACAPHSAEAHEQLGRMLLEAGYLDQANARLEEAIALNPQLRSARWEIARARALEGRWGEYQAIVDEMMAEQADRPVSRARYAWWRHDLATLRALQEPLLAAQQMFVPGLMTGFVASFLDDDAAWPTHRAALCASVLALPPNHRRRAFADQLLVEAAAYHGDSATALDFIAHAIDEGLFDLHWLDRCPLLARVRQAPQLGPLRAQIKRRADAILDALYGDHDLATAGTVYSKATSDR